jgi:hypothetical protein
MRQSTSLALVAIAFVVRELLQLVRMALNNGMTKSEPEG